MDSTLSLDNENTKSFQEVGKIIQSLDKNLRSKKLYSTNNPVLIKHKEELLTLMSTYVQVHEKLHLLIEPFEIKVDDQVVYDQPNRQENFAFKLFNDGIRSLTIQSGVTPEEVDRFLDALIQSSKTTGTETGIDAASALWEQEFEHIRYTIANTIVEDLPKPGEKSAEEKVEEILDASMNAYQGVGASSQDDDDEEESLFQSAKATISPVSAGKLFQTQTVLDAQDLQKIRQDLNDCDRPERLLLDFVDMVLAVLMEERDRESFFRFVDYLGQVLENTLMQSKIELTRLLLELVHRFDTKPIPMLEKNPNLIHEILEQLWTQGRIQLFLLFINEAQESSFEEIEAVIQKMGPEPMKRIIAHLDSVKDVVRKKLILRGATKTDGSDPLGLASFLIASKEPDKIRIALYLLSLSKNEASLDLIAKLISHPNQQIKKESMVLIRRYPGSKAVRALLPALSDPSEEIRIFTLKMLSAVGDKETAKNLGVTIMNPAFIQKSLSERKAFFMAVAKLAGDDFLPYLEGIFETKNWFKNPAVAELHLCGVMALVSIQTPKAQALLENLKLSKDRSIQSALLAAAQMAKELR